VHERHVGDFWAIAAPRANIRDVSDGEDTEYFQTDLDQSARIRNHQQSGEWPILKSRRSGQLFESVDNMLVRHDEAIVDDEAGTDDWWHYRKRSVWARQRREARYESHDRAPDLRVDLVKIH
jgi:hypothetical protein